MTNREKASYAVGELVVGITRVATELKKLASFHIDLDDSVPIFSYRILTRPNVGGSIVIPLDVIAASDCGAVDAWVKYEIEVIRRALV